MIAEFESRILALIDDMVEHASDDELFASGYLRGHLTLAVAELEEGDDHSADAVSHNVTRSLEKAIQAGELRHATRRWCWGCGRRCSRRRSSNYRRMALRLSGLHSAM
jgi:YfcL protein.